MIDQNNPPNQNNLPTNTEIDPNKVNITPPQVSEKKIGSPISFQKKGLILLVLLIISFGAIFFGIRFSENQKRKAQEAAYAKAKQLTDDARKSYVLGDFKTTEAKLAESLKVYPNNANALASLIKAIASQGNQTGKENESFSRAKPYIDQALKQYPKDSEVLLSVGYAYETKGEYEQALKYYEDALKIDEKNGKTWFQIGHVLEFLGREIEAFNNYERAYSLDPNDPLILIAEGRHQFSLGNTQKAYDLYIQASNLNNIPNHLKSEALTNASIIKRSEFIYMQEAIDLSKKAVDADPNYSPALAAYGFNLAINGKAEGLDYLKKSIAANPRISANYSLTALILRAIKKYDEAISYQKQGLEKIENDNTLLNPELKSKKRVQMLYDLAITYSVAGGNPETLPTLKLVVQMDQSYKKKIKTHVEQSGLFKELAQDEQFLSLIR